MLCLHRASSVGSVRIRYAAPSLGKAEMIIQETADWLTIKHALEKCLEDNLWQDQMEIVDYEGDGEIVKLDNKQRIQELNLAIAALDRFVQNNEKSVQSGTIS
jgi:hypothetical protein